MQETKPWYVLDIDVSNAISDPGHETIKTWKQSVSETTPGGYWKLYQDTGLTDFFTADFLQNMSCKGIPVDMMVSFYRKSRYCHPTAHIDGSLTRRVVFALNWVIPSGDDDSEMVWYEMPKIEIPVSSTEYGTAQVDIDTTDLLEIARHRVGPVLTLVRVDTPHNVIVRDKERFVVSLRPKIDEICTWAEAVHRFQPWILK